MKPFKPPSRQITSWHRDTIDQGPSKRRRLSPEVVSQDASGSKSALNERQPAAAFTSASIQRSPLKPIEVTNAANGPRLADEAAQYFNVLWRRPTTKKNKTWDGDGILTYSNGFASLEDTSGKALGRVPYRQGLDVGSQLMLAGREVEIESTMSKQDAMSGKRFLGKTLTQIKPVVAVTVAQQQTKKSAPACNATQSRPQNADFRLPMARNSIPNTAGDNRVPTPRHDPNVSGALVMKRPKSVPKGKHVVDVVVDPLLTKNLREHQRAGVAFMYECVMGLRDYAGEGAILADEMGLGKTLQTIALLWTLLKQNPIYESQPVIKKALIVCPVSLINNWRKEFKKWLGNERIGVLVADDKSTRITDFTLGKAYNVLIIGYERLRSVKEELLKGDGVDIVIADEGHRLKTAKNKSADAIKSLPTERRVILSGTPIQNDLEEFYCMIDFVNPNLLGKYSVFKREFEVPILKSQQPGATKKEREKGEARSQELAVITSMFVLRRTADILSKYLPPRTEYVVFCRPTTAQATVYRSILRSPIFSAALGSSGVALELINVLKRVCNSPSLLLSKGDKSDESTRQDFFESVPVHLLKSPGSSGKLQVLDQLLHKIRTATSEKVVLVSNYTSTLDVLARLLASMDYPYLRLDGSTPPSKRQDLVDRFNRSSSNNFFVFLLSAKAGGLGLNLIGASRLVLFDCDWNPSVDLQAMARIHRQGQTRPCYIYRLLTKGALDEKIYQRQITKSGLADSIVDGKSSASSFTREELRDLFTLDETDGCQTHKLLGCTCKSDGAQCEDVPLVEATVEGEIPERDEDGLNVLHLEDGPNEYVNSSVVCGSFTSSSSVDMEAQEEELRSKRKQGKAPTHRDKMLSLMQFTHIDATIWRQRAAEVTALESTETSLDDGVLHSVLKDEANRVDFLFVKQSVCPAVKADCE